MVEVKGQGYQHATTKATAQTTGESFTFKTHAKVTWEVGAEAEATTDSQGQIDGFVIKKQTSKAGMKLKLSEYFNFRSFLFRNNPGLGLLQCQFDLPVSYGNNINALKTATLRTCKLQREPIESEDGQDVLMVDLDIFFIPRDSTFPDGPLVVYE